MHQSASRNAECTRIATSRRVKRTVTAAQGMLDSMEGVSRGLCALHRPDIIVRLIAYGVRMNRVIINAIVKPVRRRIRPAATARKVMPSLLTNVTRKGFVRAEAIRPLALITTLVKSFVRFKLVAGTMMNTAATALQDT